MEMPDGLHLFRVNIWARRSGYRLVEGSPFVPPGRTRRRKSCVARAIATWAAHPTAVICVLAMFPLKC